MDMKRFFISVICSLFSFFITSAQIIPEGIYCIKSARDTRFCIDLSENGRIANGQNILLWTYWGGNGQKWIVTHDRGAIIIRSYVNRNYVLDLRGGIATNDQNVWLWEYNGTNGQRWFPKYENGHYVIQSAVNTNYNIDLYCGNTSDGVNIQCYENNGFYAQHWIFERLDGGSSNSGGGTVIIDNSPMPCVGCGGTKKCSVCNGKGYTASASTRHPYHECGACNGTGICQACRFQ